MILHLKTDCPCFPGFYNSFLYDLTAENEALSAVIEHETRNGYKCPPDLLDMYLQLCPDSLRYTFDFAEYTKAAARAFCGVASDSLSFALRNPGGPFEYVGKIELTFKEIVSPREYNFVTDRVTCDATITYGDVGNILVYLEKHRAAWNAYRAERFTSRDGFLSFYEPNDPGFESLDAWSADPVYFSAVLDFILRDHLGPDAEYSLSSDVLEKVWIGEYITLPDSLKTFLDSPEADHLRREYNRLSKQGDDYLALMGEQYRPAVIGGMGRVLRELAAEMINHVESLGA